MQIETTPASLKASYERMAKAIDILVSAMELPRTPKVNEIFDRSFMPPLADRPTVIKAAM